MSAKKKSKKKTKKKAAKKPGGSRKKFPTSPRIYTKVTPANIESVRELMALKMEMNSLTKVKYSPSYVAMMKAHASEGKDMMEFAHLVKISRDTVREWARRHPAFSEAIVEGQIYFIESLRQD